MVDLQPIDQSIRKLKRDLELLETYNADDIQTKKKLLELLCHKTEKLKHMYTLRLRLSKAILANAKAHALNDKFVGAIKKLLMTILGK